MTIANGLMTMTPDVIEMQNDGVHDNLAVSVTDAAPLTLVQNFVQRFPAVA